ncbi:MAG TPA: discoidin domain-containing protein [Bacteroidales bacterium]|nr:discoidin domain-containing protein [Bacteroidales bacterium]
MTKLIFRKGMLLAFLLISSMTTFAQNMLIESLSGPITQNEIDAFKVYMQKLVPPETPWGALNGTGHNAWGDFDGGNVIEAYGLMFEATGDMELLNSMIHWTDICVSQRNDLLPKDQGGQRVMWTGKINKVWVPNYPGSTSAGYAGGEDGDTKAHIAYSALLILKNPSIWSQTIPDGNPFSYGVTYLDRAKDYMAKCDESNDDYTRVQFAQVGTNLIRNPTNWPTGYHTMEAVNIQMMLDGDFQRMAECHEILGDAPERVAQYDAIVKASMDECIKGMAACHPTQVNGKTVYAWCYYPWDIYPRHIETVGHAAYDMIGVYRAFNRPVYGYSPALVTPFANALAYVMSLGNNSFSTNVDGTGNTQNYMQAQWLLLGDWEPKAFELVAAANLASGRYKTTPLMTATMLWMKNRRYHAVVLPPNIVLNKATTVSNFYKNTSSYSGGSAVDGNLSSRWACDDGVTSASLEVDLGGFYTFGQVATLDYLSRVTSYLIQYWNGSNWADAFQGNSLGAVTKTDSFNPVTGSKVRLNVSTTDVKGPSIYEFSVYGYPSTVNPPVDLKKQKTHDLSFQLLNTSGRTNLRYSIPALEQVTIDVYTVTGQKIKTAFQELQEAGTHYFTLKPTDFADGLYLLQLCMGTEKRIKKWLVSN